MWGWPAVAISSIVGRMASAMWYFSPILVGHGSGISSRYNPQFSLAEHSCGLRKACLSGCLAVCHKNCLLWTIPSIPSISFFLELLSLLLFRIRAVLRPFPPFCSQSERFSSQSPPKAPVSAPNHPKASPKCPNHPHKSGASGPTFGPTKP